ncbi:pyridoxal-phosphate dependent enzyme [Streptomyces sp. NA04227]|uniref:pyridoxal-phosphate dependent enzyme n=1 Tax=Streptomyces sp. NA04227 TaxID=2742136 RepID=UPI001590EBA4|nr:pyridoxal-phosphate dependent enzyme [Streptomyces sp. NA04227]QKW10431.1 pyridoxal-phosphate dependent enzyme [Streptomyces sp. NA04227]
MHGHVQPHIAEAIKRPDLVALRPDLLCLRFETMKIHSALGAVRHLLETGAVKPGDTLIDSSSGIYAQALALACHRYGMKCHIVGSTTVDRTLRVQLEILGATLEQVRPSKNLRLDQELRVRRIAEILEANPTYHWMRQYHDEIHYYGYREVAETLARELPEGPVTLVGGVGSGASTGALASYLREWGKDVALVGVQPFGSVTFGSEHVSDPDMIIAGIGSAIPFRNVRHGLYDRVHWVNFTHALSGAVDLLRTSGIFAGLSTGAAHLAARWELGRGDSRTHVFIAADTGHRYVESAYARHAEALDIDALKPHEVSSLDELKHPWSTAAWPDLAESAELASADAEFGAGAGRT